MTPCSESVVLVLVLEGLARLRTMRLLDCYVELETVNVRWNAMIQTLSLHAVRCILSLLFDLVRLRLLREAPVRDIASVGLCLLCGARQMISGEHLRHSLVQLSRVHMPDYSTPTPPYPWLPRRQARSCSSSCGWTMNDS